MTGLAVFEFAIPLDDESLLYDGLSSTAKERLGQVERYAMSLTDFCAERVGTRRGVRSYSVFYQMVGIRRPCGALVAKMEHTMSERIHEDMRVKDATDDPEFGI